MRKASIFNRDYSILSTYLDKWATVIVFSAIIALALGALYLKSDDLAHMPVVIGVCAFDSARSESALESFAEFCRGKGCGDIRWRFIAPGQSLSGCDFYLATSLQLSSAFAHRSLGCALIAASREARRYSRSAVIVRHGVRSLPPSGARIIFVSRSSAAGFLAPYRSLEKAGYPLAGARIDFSGSYPREERVIFGVLYGAYDAGGISLERFHALEKAGILGEEDIDVLFEGEAFPEFVLAYEPSAYIAERRAFVRRLPGVYDKAPHSLRCDLSDLGIAGFYSPREGDIELMKTLAPMIPALFDESPSRARPGDR